MTRRESIECEIVVVGGSAGALDTLFGILKLLPIDFRLPLLVCQHLHISDDGHLVDYLNTNIPIEVIEAGDKMDIRPGRVYVAPSNYHLLVERSRSLSLCVGPPNHWSRPSIDYLFETASYAYTRYLLGVLLSGASVDGTEGMSTILKSGGITVAQEPSSAEAPLMPKSAIDQGCVGMVLSPIKLQKLMLHLHDDPTMNLESLRNVVHV